MARPLNCANANTQPPNPASPNSHTYHPPRHSPPTRMAYYYQDPNHDIYAYEYGDDSNHGNNKYNEYYAEPNHCEYEDQYHNNADHKYAPQEFEQGYGEAEHEVQEHR